MDKPSPDQILVSFPRQKRLLPGFRNSLQLVACVAQLFSCFIILSAFIQLMNLQEDRHAARRSLGRLCNCKMRIDLHIKYMWPFRKNVCG